MKPPGDATRFGRTASGRLLGMLHSAGLLQKMAQTGPARLTALNYHRIEDPYRSGFDTFKANVSATPSAFREQMEYLREHYNAVSCAQLAGWLRGECDLPPRPAIITFDDGYHDNLAHAYPVLRELGLPAVIFLCTDNIGSDAPFAWDFAAYCFFHTGKDRAELPLTGAAAWSSTEGRELQLRSWFAAAKEAPESRRRELLDALARSLDVAVPEDGFRGLHLSWDQVRELHRNGIEMGAHTRSHPILSRVPLEQAEREIAGSKQRIEAELGEPVISFAYPNGRLTDFSAGVMDLLRKAGIQVAFTLQPGPMRLASVRRQPLAIRRVFVGYADTFPRFLAKLAGFARLTTL